MGQIGPWQKLPLQLFMYWDEQHHKSKVVVGDQATRFPGRTDLVQQLESSLLEKIQTCTFQN
jgi:hypothetical protein